MKNIGQDVVVTKEDQKSINNFSKLYSRHQEIAKQQAELKQKFEKHDDTLTELELNEDDDQVRYRFGNSEQAKELVEQDKGKVQKQQKAKREQFEDNEKRMKKMKASLYSKFGNSINLEE